MSSCSVSLIKIKMTDENIVNRAEFQDKLKILYSERSDSNRSLWNKKHEFIVIKFLQEVEECSIQKKIAHYHYAKTYEFVRTQLTNEYFEKKKLQ